MHGTPRSPPWTNKKVWSPSRLSPSFSPSFLPAPLPSPSPSPLAVPLFSLCYFILHPFFLVLGLGDPSSSLSLTQTHTVSLFLSHTQQKNTNQTNQLLPVSTRWVFTRVRRTAVVSFVRSFPLHCLVTNTLEPLVLLSSLALFRDPGDVLSALTCSLCHHVLLQPFQVLCEQGNPSPAPSPLFSSRLSAVLIFDHCRVRNERRRQRKTLTLFIL